MTPRRIRLVSLVHKWSSILSTLFLLLLCITGLPLIFHDEIDSLADSTDAASAMTGPASASDGVPLDRLVQAALASDAHADAVPLFIGFSQDSPLITVTTGPAPDAAARDMVLHSFDRSTGRALGVQADDGIMEMILDLHVDLMLGLPGMFLLGAMGVLFLIALLSGLVLYAPFMRRLRFGTVRTDRGRRLRWLDQHNLFGITALAWALVVGMTGAINAFADPLVDHWREGELAAMTASHAGDDALLPADYSSIDGAMAAAKRALPGLSPQFIAFPGGTWSSARHYALFFQGDTPLTQNVLTPALIDAGSGQLVDARRMPASMAALMLSKPLHFGDYGGLPMKLLWALLDLVTIWVLVTGLFLWLRRTPARSTGSAPRGSLFKAQGAAS